MEFSVKIPRKVPQELNRGTFCEISTESSMVWSLWNFHQKVPRLSFSGTFRGNSTESSMFGLCGNSTEISTVLCQASWILPSF